LWTAADKPQETQVGKQRKGKEGFF